MLWAFFASFAESLATFAVKILPDSGEVKPFTAKFAKDPAKDAKGAQLEKRRF